MLLEFGAKNFFCFKEGFEVSFRLGANCPNEISRDKNFSTVLCVKGANGSGKTNVLKALAFLGYFCCDSFNRKPDDRIHTEPFFFNKESSHFYAEFSIAKVEYLYELEVTQAEVLAEKIYRKDKRRTLIIERNKEKLNTCTEEYKDLKMVKLRRNASLISTAHQYEIESIQKIYDFFFTVSSNVSFLGKRDHLPDYDTISRLYFKDKNIFNFVKDIICRCDLGIKDIEIQEKEDEKGNKKYTPVFEHKVGVKNHYLTFHTESSGTKSLYLQLGQYKIVLGLGGVFILDEFDINLHPDILPKLVDLFIDEDINKKNAQMIFTTHNSAIMDKLGKYRTVLVNKENNESFLYRLDEIPGDIIRNDRPIESIYKSGKIGGVPKI